LCPAITGANNDVSKNWSFHDFQQGLCPNRSYAYNAIGSPPFFVETPNGGDVLGLDGGWDYRSQSLRPRAESWVVVPADMIAVGDYDPLLTDDVATEICTPICSGWG
jgi:hypothetical protein